MEMLNPHCGVDRDPRGVVRLAISNAGSLNILSTPVINAVREGLETLARDESIRVLVLAGQSEKSMIGGADIKEMAGLDQNSAEKFITGLRDLCEAVRAFPGPVIARMPGWCLGGGLEVAAACATGPGACQSTTRSRRSAAENRFTFSAVLMGAPLHDGYHSNGAPAASQRAGVSDP